MNRRQFLTGASAIAVSAALPAAPATALVDEYFDTNTGTVVLQQVYWQGRYYWISGKDNIVHWADSPITWKPVTVAIQPLDSPPHF